MAALSIEAPRSSLRERAEARLGPEPQAVAGLSGPEMVRLVHELDVHRIELGMQNEELLKAQCELAESRDRLADFYESAPVGYLSLDPGWVVLDSNRAALELLGVERSQALAGLRLAGFVADESREAFQAHREAVQASLGRQGCELVLRRADGSRFPARVESIRREDPASGLRVLRCVICDLTERRRAEQALRAGERRRDELVALLAHELRNPLAPIRNAMEVCRIKGSGDPAVEAARAIVDRQLNRLVRLVDDLLDLGRVSGGKLRLRLERVDLGEVLSQAIELARPAIESGGHRLALALPESRIALDADPLRLAQVFHCLLDNACKFTEQGGEIRVEVGLQAGVVRVSVADTGIGIDSGDLGRIFEMFVQAGTTGERTQEGLGIGLALARALAGLHGGEIEAQSEGPGRGSRFVVRLPAAPEGLGSAAPAVSLATAAPGSIRLPEPAAPARRVLVADDNPDLVDSLATLLRLSGFEVETARDGLEAVAAALRFRPSLILLDLGMPRLDGYSACRRIRELPGGQSIAILAQTGWGQEEDRQRSLDAGFDGHLIKPVDPMALIRIAMDSPPSLA